MVAASKCTRVHENVGRACGEQQLPVAFPTLQNQPGSVSAALRTN